MPGNPIVFNSTNIGDSGKKCFWAGLESTKDNGLHFFCLADYNQDAKSVDKSLGLGIQTPACFVIVTPEGKVYTEYLQKIFCYNSSTGVPIMRNGRTTGLPQFSHWVGCEYQTLQLKKSPTSAITQVEIDEDGIMIATFANGNVETFGQIIMARPHRYNTSDNTISSLVTQSIVDKPLIADRFEFIKRKRSTNKDTKFVDLVAFLDTTNNTNEHTASFDIKTKDDETVNLKINILICEDKWDISPTVTFSSNTYSRLPTRTTLRKGWPKSPETFYIHTADTDILCNLFFVASTRHDSVVKRYADNERELFEIVYKQIDQKVLNIMEQIEGAGNSKKLHPKNPNCLVM